MSVGLVEPARLSGRPSPSTVAASSPGLLCPTCERDTCRTVYTRRSYNFDPLVRPGQTRERFNV